MLVVGSFTIAYAIADAITSHPSITSAHILASHLLTSSHHHIIITSAHQWQKGNEHFAFATSITHARPGARLGESI